MALAPLGHLIFSELRKHDPAQPEWWDRDRFVLSCGHASMLQYALLHLSGYALSLEDIKSFRQWGSLTPGHPEYRHTAGVETTTGPLGQGIGNAVGMAMAERHLAARFNRPGHEIINHRTWVIASDGDLMEGVASEASSIAGLLGLGKLIVFWDDNHITIDGETDLSFREDVLKRYEAYGWHVGKVEDGNDLESLRQQARAAMADARPSLIAVRTVIGYPSPGKGGSSDAHGAPLGAAEISATKKVMGWPDVPFHVPAEMEDLKRRVKERGHAAQAAWSAQHRAYAAEFPELARDLRTTLESNLPAGWAAGLTEFPVDPKGMATRKASGIIINDFAKAIPNFVGGSADLAGSNNTWQKGKPSFETGQGIPCNMHFGVREHGMGSICNGMALHGGVIPYAATFLVFCDYMRPAIRLAALMNLPVRYVFTHDSIGLGEDGPTHQPVEQLASLRSIPNLVVLRPADANEVRECWIAALERSGPAALILSRQDLPTLNRSNAKASGASRGAYVIRECESGAPELVLLASGSEVSLALKAAAELESKKLRVRVISMPSWELFEEQDAAYKESVLPKSVQARVVVEAGIRMGWERYAGQLGGYVTMETFGASAPAPELFRRFGFTVERVVEAGLSAVRRSQLGSQSWEA
jgi:transketolase